MCFLEGSRAKPLWLNTDNFLAETQFFRCLKSNCCERQSAFSKLLDPILSNFRLGGPITSGAFQKPWNFPQTNAIRNLELIGSQDISSMISSLDQHPQARRKAKASHHTWAGNRRAEISLWEINFSNLVAEESLYVIWFWVTCGMNTNINKYIQ